MKASRVPRCLFFFFRRFLWVSHDVFPVPANKNPGRSAGAKEKSRSDRGTSVTQVWGTLQNM